MARAKKAAPRVSSRLNRGESGTGKELLAPSHSPSEHSQRQAFSSRPIAEPSHQIWWESELFGHVKGSFTEAVATSDRVGHFGEAARTGEPYSSTRSGELPLAAQVSNAPSGASRGRDQGASGEITRTLQVDVRVMAATNRNLAKEVGDRSLSERTCSIGWPCSSLKYPRSGSAMMISTP